MSRSMQRVRGRGALAGLLAATVVAAGGCALAAPAQADAALGGGAAPLGWAVLASAALLAVGAGWRSPRSGPSRPAPRRRRDDERALILATKVGRLDEDLQLPPPRPVYGGAWEEPGYDDFSPIPPERKRDRLLPTRLDDGRPDRGGLRSA